MDKCQWGVVVFDMRSGMTSIEQVNLRKVANSDESELWLQARMTGVTASDVASFEDGAKLDKLVYKKLNNTFKGNVWTEWGLQREPHLLEWAGFEQNKTLFRSVENPRFMATPDGYKISSDDEFVLCQVKTTSKKWDEIPENYLRQCQWEMYVMGASRNLLVWELHQQFIPTDLEPKARVLKRDDKEISRLVSMANDFLVELDKQKEG
jgi:hypothetical protein